MRWQNWMARKFLAIPRPGGTRDSSFNGGNLTTPRIRDKGAESAEDGLQGANS